MMENNDVRLSQDVCRPAISSGNLYGSLGNLITLQLRDPAHDTELSELSLLYNSYYFGKGNSNYATEPVQNPVAEDDTVYETVKNEEGADVSPLSQKRKGKDLEEAMFNEGLFCFYDILSVARQDDGE